MLTTARARKNKQFCVQKFSADMEFEKMTQYIVDCRILNIQETCKRQKYKPSQTIEIQCTRVHADLKIAHIRFSISANQDLETEAKRVIQFMYTDEHEFVVILGLIAQEHHFHFDFVKLPRRRYCQNLLCRLSNKDEKPDQDSSNTR